MLRNSSFLPAVLTLLIFFNAGLMFLLEPMVGQLLLPLLGGSPMVWNTCMVFFQAMLLAGYLYAHLSTGWLGPRRQAAVHLLVFLVPVIVLPISVNKALAPEGETNPVLGVLLLLTVATGLPFFVVSASAPLLQKWFASTDHPAAKDPYFLYAASNLGSMLALLFYPWLIEPSLKLVQQSWAWYAGYGLLFALTAICALLMWRSAPAPALAEGPTTTEDPDPEPADQHITASRSSRSRSRKMRSAARMKKPSKPEPEEVDEEDPIHQGDRPVTVWRRLHWIALAFIPSSLMLGATTYITTDIAAIPLLWVLPLALYLLSFILVFSRLPNWVHRVMILIMPLMVLLLVVMMLSGAFRPRQWAYILCHPAVLFVVAMVCHGELARDRPATKYLTGFYLWMSVGGVLGGMFNALLAPLIFKGIVEYQLAMVLACMLMPPLGPREGLGFGIYVELALAGLLALGAFIAFYIGMRRAMYQGDWRMAEGYDFPDWLTSDIHTTRLGQAMVACFVLLIPLGLFLPRGSRLRTRYYDLLLPAGIGALTLGLIYGLIGREWQFEWLRDFIQSWTPGHVSLSADRIVLALVYGVPALACYLFVERPLRFGLAVGAFLLTANAYDWVSSPPLHQERSYFGVLKVTTQTKGETEYHLLTHGTTTHGMQSMDPERRTEPLTYYHRNGPVGQLFRAFPELTHNYAVVGLGTGTMAAYGDADHRITFYEIDRHVRDIATNPKYFTYLTDYAERRGEPARIVLGDARLQLEKSTDKYGIIIVDAFSSDAIPVHLITLEALKMFFDRLTEHGIVAFHISNRWLNLAPVLDHLTKELGAAALIQTDSGDGADWYASSWVAVARNKEDVLRLMPEDWLAWQGRNAVLAMSVSPTASLVGIGAASAAFRQWPNWQPLQPHTEQEAQMYRKVGVWTDDYSNLLSVFDWER